MSLTWDRFSQWAEQSHCKRYSVSAAKVVSGFKFQAWYWPPKDAQGHDAIQELLGTFDDAESARQCCEADCTERKGRAA